MIRWFANNGIAANMMLLGILFAGGWVAWAKVPLEVQPQWESNAIYISMNYRGATAEDVSENIVVPIENAIKNLPEIKSIDSTARRGNARIWVYANDGADLETLLEEVKSRVDRISTFSNESDKPNINIPDSNSWREVITVAVTGNMDEEDLRKAAERVRDDLTEMDGISQAELAGERPFEIAIEADQKKLRAYDLSFQDLIDAVRRSSINLSAGTIQSTSGPLLVRTVGQAYTREEFERIPIRAADGAEVQLGEVATIKDGFEEDKQIIRFNGEPALMVEVMRHDKESAIQTSKLVHEYVASASERFPDGISLYAWDDESISIKGRLSTLTWSLVQGCLFVFIILGLFLRPSLAFCVILGIPVAFAGGILLMPSLGVTANMMSLFGFIIVLGLVVDDAIVTGENIFSKLRTGMDPLKASIAGTKEVATPVTFGIITTIVAFIPLMFLTGHEATYAKQIPPIIAPVLLFSLIESKLILPSHLKHVKAQRKKLGPFSRFQKVLADGLESFVQKVYKPSLKFALNHRYAVVAIFITMALAMIGYWRGGHLGFVAMPTVDRLKITAYLDLPHDTKLEETDKYIHEITKAAEQLQKEFVDPGSGESLIQNIYTETGDSNWSSVTVDTTEGRVSVEILPPSVRTEPGPRNSVISARWQEIVGEIPEAMRFYINAESSGYSRYRQQDDPIEIELRGPSSEKKLEIAEQIEDLLESYEGIGNAYVRGDQVGQDELKIKLNQRGAELGITQQMLAQQIRQAFFGQEAQRIQRGGDEIRVMVRLTREERESLHTLDTLKIQPPNGIPVPLENVADIAMEKSPGYIQRIDGAEVIEIRATGKDESSDLLRIAKIAEPEIQKLVNEGDSLSFRYVGYIAEHEEARLNMFIGAAALLATLYALLAIPFKSLLQPLFVMLAIPFGVIGALLGHIIMGITPSWLSMFGMLALAGVVVNDSLVMVDYINRKRANGVSLGEAIIGAGSQRFRPIFLTSITTFAGLVPLIFERSIQAQLLIPMAVSLGFGILFATAITLYLIPSSYKIADDIKHGFGRAFRWYFKPFGSKDAVPEPKEERPPVSPTLQKSEKPL